MPERVRARAACIPHTLKCGEVVVDGRMAAREPLLNLGPAARRGGSGAFVEPPERFVECPLGFASEIRKRSPAPVAAREQPLKYFRSDRVLIGRRFGALGKPRPEPFDPGQRV